MAENKKSFILYADQMHCFNELSDKEAGQLIKHLFAYINDQNPEPPNKIVKIAFEPIKQQLKRDLKDWEQKKQKRVDAGKKGGKISGEKRSKTKQNEALVHFASKNEANEAVNVNGNVNVNVIEDVRLRELFELFKRATFGYEYDNGFLLSECNKFLNKYPNTVIRASGGLVNSWVGRITMADQEKWMNDKKEAPVVPFVNRDQKELENLLKLTGLAQQ